MVDVINLAVADIIEREKLSKSYKDELIVIDLERHVHRAEVISEVNAIYQNGELTLRDGKVAITPNARIRVDALSFIIMLNGEIDLNINGTDYHFESQVVIDILDLHVLQNIKISTDFRGYHVMLSKNLLFETMRGIKQMPMSNFISLCNYPIRIITCDEANMLEDIALRIIKNIDRNDHLYQRDMIKNELRYLCMELANIVVKRGTIPNSNLFKNREEVVARFIQLLNINCKEHSSVDFYARQLCIDAKHLSRILKIISGKSANTWIDQARIKESKLYLKEHENSIQQIADIMCFSDQSAFGKFFKKHCGMSPLSFRREAVEKG